MKNSMMNLASVNSDTYRLLVESVKDYAIFFVDEAGFIRSWNRGAAFIKGYTSEEIIGKHISVFYKPEAVANGEPGQNLEKARTSGVYEAEGWRVRKDGSQFWADIVITALKDTDGNLIGFGKVTRDLTAKKKAQQEIKQLNENLTLQVQKTQTEVNDYKHALDAASIVAITDQKGKIVYANDNFCAISQFSKEELMGQDHRIINSGYHSKEFFKQMWRTIANGGIWRNEIKNKAKNGGYYWVDTTIIPFLNEGGKPYQYLSIRSDITQRKGAEEQILKINEDLEKKIRERTYELTEALERERELGEMKSRFVSVASHEFRTPLSTVLSSTSLLDHYRAPEQEDKYRKHVDRIKSSVKHLTEILDDFLSLDKLEQGKVEASSVKFSLQELVYDVMEEVDMLLRKKHQTIGFSFAGTAEVFQDKKILRNVLLNLLSNAIKYSPEEKTIYIDASVTNNKATISVTDKGIGIPEKAQKNLFTKYFRADNVANIQGTGLGLNIVKKYLELLGGTISFTSEENKGSVFTVSFPQYKT